jgi:FixJ family two-component response regulator
MQRVAFYLFGYANKYKLEVSAMDSESNVRVYVNPDTSAPVYASLITVPVAPSVRFVGNDRDLLEMLERSLPPLGLTVSLYLNGADLLSQSDADSIGCVVLDVRLPGMGGLELQARMNAKNACMPFIFVTEYGDIALAVKAMKQGAFDFIEKPCHPQGVIDSISEAISQSQLRYQSMVALRTLSGRFERLTKTERKIMAMVVDGLLNKEIAGALYRSEVTIKVHRRRVMEKMEARSLPDLVRFARRLSEGASRA